MGQNGALWLFHRLTVAAVYQPARRVTADLDKIFASKNRKHTGHGGGGVSVDRFDRTIGHVRAGKHSRTLAVGFDIVAITTTTS